MTELVERAQAAAPPTPARKSAIAELLQYRELVALLVVRELKVRYKRSVLGLLWTMLNPLLLMVVYTVVFATIMRAPQRNFAIFLLSGLLPWLFFSTSVLQGLNSILTNQELIRKVRLPQAVFPLSVVGSNLVNFSLSLAPLLLLMAVLGQPFTPALLFIPVAIFILAVFTSGVTLLFATFTVFFRDVYPTRTDARLVSACDIAAAGSSAHNETMRSTRAFMVISRRDGCFCVLPRPASTSSSLSPRCVA